MLDYHRITALSELDVIYESMRKGVFDTDKIALDPHFGSEKSGYRYYAWSKDLIEKDMAVPYMVTQEDRAIGYFILKKVSERMGDSFLAALFDNSNDNGLGFSVLYYPMLEAKKNGLKKMITGVSSNNPASLKMHLALGYQIKSLHYVMTKHINIT